MQLIDPLLDYLPQIGAISPEDRQRWVAGIMRHHSPRAKWHVRRLHGFGGSEIGAILRHELKNGEGGFSTAKSVIEGKLLKRLPSFENHHMRRGNVLEPLARLAFLIRYSAVRDLAALKAIQEPHGKNGYEWHVGNPDDLCLIKNKRFVCDYKVPNTYTEAVEFDYDAQVHHYALGARLRGIKVDGVIIAKLDIAPEIAAGLVDRMANASNEQVLEMAETIAKTDMPGLRVVAQVLDFSREMQLNILDIGRHYWENHVKAGLLPENRPEQMVELDQSQLERIAVYQQQYLMASAATSHLKTISAKCASVLTEMLTGVDLDNKDLPLAATKVSRKNSYDEAALFAEAKALGAQDDDLKVQTKSYSIPALLEEIQKLKGDPSAPQLFEVVESKEKAIDYIVRLGGDPEVFRSNELQVRVSTKKETVQISDVLKESAAELYGGWMHKLGAVEKDDQFDPIDDELEQFQNLSHAAEVHSDVFSDDTIEDAAVMTNTYVASMR